VPFSAAELSCCPQLAPLQDLWASTRALSASDRVYLKLTVLRARDPDSYVILGLLVTSFRSRTGVLGSPAFFCKLNQEFPRKKDMTHSIHVRGFAPTLRSLFPFVFSSWRFYSVFPRTRGSVAGALTPSGHMFFAGFSEYIASIPGIA